MKMYSSSVDVNSLDPTSSLASSQERQSKESSIRTNISDINRDRTVNKSPLFTPSNSSMLESTIQHIANRSLSQTSHPSSTPNATIRLAEINTKQKELEEKFAFLERTILTRDLLDSSKTEIQNNQTQSDPSRMLADYLTKLEELKEQYLAEQIFLEEKVDFFRLFMWRLCSDTRNWKFLAHRIYHVQRLINSLDNYTIREPIQNQFKFISDEFIRFVKYLIAEQIKEQQRNKTKASKSSSSSITRYYSTRASEKTKDSIVDNISHTIFQEDLNNINEPIKSHLHNLKNHIDNLRNSVLAAQQRIGVCRTDTDAVTRLIEAIDDIKFDPNHFVFNFDIDDQNRIHLLELKRDIAEKSDKNEFLQLKISIDGQVKKLIEFNKQNAEQLERIKIMKNATSEARRVQAILANEPSTIIPKHRTSSYQSSRPYLTFELDHIRQYQRQALLRSPYGTIPLYRRQAWAAANLFDGHPLHLLRHMQHSLRMQIHQLLGHNPADMFAICNHEKNAIHQRNKRVDAEIFTTRDDFFIVGNDNKLYRGRIDSCRTVPDTIVKQKESKSNKSTSANDERKKINLDNLDQTVKTIADENLFDYFDWQARFDEQDLPREFYEDLFDHWKSIVCENDPCTSDSKSIVGKCEEQMFDAAAQGSDQRALSDTYLSQSNPAVSTDDRCICSDCSCTCEKHSECHSVESVCLCSQCSCQCLKDFDHETSKNQVKEEILEEPMNDECQAEKNELRRFPSLNGEDETCSCEIENEGGGLYNEKDETKTTAADFYLSDCFANRADRWTQQFDLFQGGRQSNPLPEGYDWSIVCDAPPAFGQFQTSAPIAFGSYDLSVNKKSLELDDPTTFRQSNDFFRLSSVDESTRNNHVNFQPNRGTIPRRASNDNPSLD